MCKNGGNVAVLDMNEGQGSALAKELGDASRFWSCDVTDTDSIATAVSGAAEWAKQTGKPLGGVIPAAGVGNPALVSRHPPSTISFFGISDSGKLANIDQSVSGLDSG